MFQDMGVNMPLYELEHEIKVCAKEQLMYELFYSSYCLFWSHAEKMGGQATSIHSHCKSVCLACEENSSFCAQSSVYTFRWPVSWCDDDPVFYLVP